MAEPLYKSLNKRSRSAFDSFPDLDDIAQTVSLTHKARSDSESSFPAHVVAEIRQRGVFGKRDGDTASSLSSRLVAELKGNDSCRGDPASGEFLNQAYLAVSNHFGDGLARSISFPLGKLEKVLKKRVAAIGRYRTCGKEFTGEPGFVNRLSEKKDGNKGPSVTVTVEPLGSKTCVPVLLQVVKGDSAALSSQIQARSKNSAENCVSASEAESVVEKKWENSIPDVAGLEVSSKAVVRDQGCTSEGRCPPYGTLSICGRRREMEDTFTVQPDFSSLSCNAMGGCRSQAPCSNGTGGFHFFGVYDGHGGAQASSFCKDRLHTALTEEMTEAYEAFQKTMGGGDLSQWHSRWLGIMRACFMKMDNEVGGTCPTGGCNTPGSNSNCCVNPIAPENVGSTAVVAVVGSCQIIVGNCGDSRAVLCRRAKAVPLSRDHKPDREDELRRIEASGGRVINWDCHRVGGFLAMSRAIGDRFLKKFVISEPEVTCEQRTPEDECLILASDGLWDVVSNDLACDVARRCLKSQRRKCLKDGKLGAENNPAGAAAAVLTKLALSRGSKDNITVIVVDLKAGHKWQCNK